MIAGYLLSADALRRLREAKRSKRNSVNAARYGRSQHTRYLARITGKYAGTPPYPESACYAAEQVLTDTNGYTPALSGGFIWGVDADSNTLPPLLEIRSAALYEEYQTTDFTRVPIGAIVEVWYQGNEDGEVIWYFEGPTLGELFAVDVTTDGGTAGDEVTQCSFTYEVFDLKGNSLNTLMTPQWARPQYGVMVAATHGMAYWGETELFLFCVDEVEDVEVCVDSGVVSGP